MRVIRSLKRRAGRAYRVTKKWCSRALATVNEHPIFVLGNQKSGTTAVAALLGELTALSTTLDLTTLYSSLVVDIYRENAPIETLVEQNELEFSRDIVKDPNLTFLYPHLRNRFPNARFAIVIRDPRDNIRSILDRLNLSGNQDQLQINKHWESLTEYDGMYEAWMTILDSSWMGVSATHYIEMLAARWQKATRIYLENRNQIELIRYEDFIDNKEKAIAGLASRLGLPEEKDISDQVDTQFQSRGSNRGVSWVNFFGEKNLWRIESRCAEEMKTLGYIDFCAHDE